MAKDGAFLADVKTCCSCKEEKPLEDFGRSKYIKGGIKPECNAGIGHFADNTELMERAITYLKVKR